MLLDQTPTSRLFVLLTSRPEFTPPWGQHGPLQSVNLQSLGTPAGAADDCASHRWQDYYQQRSSTADCRQNGWQFRLFVEELTKMVMESGLLTETNGHYELSRLLPPLAIPSTLQDSLMARLDRLGYN